MRKAAQMAKAHSATQATLLLAMGLTCTPSHAIDSIGQRQMLDRKITIDRQIAAPRWRGCSFYDRPDGNGASLRVGVSGVESLVDGTKVWAARRPTLQPHWNDRISSFKCDRECMPNFSENENYGGQSLHAASPNVMNLDNRWNKKASSLWVVCQM